MVSMKWSQVFYIRKMESQGRSVRGQTACTLVKPCPQPGRIQNGAGQGNKEPAFGDRWPDAELTRIGVGVREIGKALRAMKHFEYYHQRETKPRRMLKKGGNTD